MGLPVSTSNGMYYFFYDNQSGKLHTKAKKLFDDLQQKKRDATFLSFDEETVSLEKLLEVSFSQGLFESKVVCYLNNISLNDEISKSLKTITKQFKESASIFVWIEDSLKKADLEVIKQHAEKTTVEEKLEKGEKTFDVFSLANLFGEKNKKGLWTALQEAKTRKIAAEEIHGILWWQLKSIILASKTKTASEAGLKPFVFSKAKGFAKSFSDKELTLLPDLFVAMYHKAHRGEVDLYVELEKLVLRL